MMELYTAELLSDDEESSDILECLKTLLNIRAGTQPADRDLGISWDCLDQLPETAEALFVVELEDKVEKYEPRAEVREVTFKYLSDGTIKPHIVFQRRKGKA